MALDYFGSAAEKAWDKTKVELERTICSLAKIVIDRCDGSDYIPKFALHKLQTALNKMLEARDFLK